MPPGPTIASGRDAIAAHYNAAFQAGVTDLAVNILEVRGHGATSAVEIGETTVTVNGQQIAGRYLHVWVLENGQWYLSRDIYHQR